MDNRRRNAIIRQAELLLKRHQMFSAPVNVQLLAEQLGIFVVEQAYESDSVSGASIADGEKLVISVNRDHGNMRKRFTIAHELGHLQLHRETPVNVSKSDTFGSMVFFRDKDSSKGEYIQEIEANLFASTILMPKDLIESAIEEEDLGVILDDAAIKTLAKKFQVSELAMGIRLSSLSST